MKHFNIVTLPGDGIGPEVTSAAVRILESVCGKYDVSLEISEHKIGGVSYETFGTPITEEALEDCKKSDGVLLGAVGGPKWDTLDKDLRPEAALLRLRKELGVYANLRPVFVHKVLRSASSLKEHVLEGVNILIVRELTGGIYFGRPRYTQEEDGITFSVDTLRYSVPEIERVAHKAFEAAAKRSSKICSVDKANVLESSRLWRKTVNRVAGDYPEITLEHMLVDNCAMQLVRHPKQFDVILTGNLFGDILSDEAAMLTGSIGMLPSASLGDGIGLYEPVHGSAPDIAGQNIANPLAAIASVALMCRYSLGLEEAAEEIESAISEFLAAGYRTADIFSQQNKNETLLGTRETGERIHEILHQKQEPTLKD
ncbi:MAG: 3-isopropylmalate dehydrogenase [Balneolaceae bacterium]